MTNVGPAKSSVTRVPSLTGTLPSRVGFRGSEELGDGYSAVFLLEQGFAPDKGTLNQGGRAWGRQANFRRATTPGRLARAPAPVDPELEHRQHPRPEDRTADPPGSLTSKRPTPERETRSPKEPARTGQRRRIDSRGRDAPAPAPGGAGAAPTPSKGKAGRATAAPVPTANWGMAMPLGRPADSAGTAAPDRPSPRAHTRTGVRGSAEPQSARPPAGGRQRNTEGTKARRHAGVTAGSSDPPGRWPIGSPNRRTGDTSSTAEPTMAPAPPPEPRTTRPSEQPRIAPRITRCTAAIPSSRSTPTEPGRRCPGSTRRASWSVSGIL